jgi:hypothetical protein
MYRDEHGIARALRMRAWRDHKGGQLVISRIKCGELGIAGARR